MINKIQLFNQIRVAINKSFLSKKYKFQELKIENKEFKKNFNTKIIPVINKNFAELSIKNFFLKTPIQQFSYSF